MARQQIYSPVGEYLHQCASVYGEDDELLNSIAKTYLGADSELHAVFIRKTLIAAVARALSPGCKVDTVCILSGAQDFGKSSFWRILAGDWFDDSVGSTSDKDERLKLHQSWIVEWAELEAVFKRKDISAVKAFITTQTDQIRPPYGRTVKEFPRPSILVGTTNFDEFLADPTGNRRFWVVPVSLDKLPFDQLAEERDRIWAAATKAFMRGESWTLPTELKQAARESAREYELSDPWEEPIMNYVEGKERVSADEVLSHALNLEIDRQDRGSQIRVTNLLKANGWTTSREYVLGRRRRFWYSPFFNKTDCPICPKEGEKQAAVVGQPMGQPMGQPLDHAEEPLNIPLRDKRDNQDNQIPIEVGNHDLLYADHRKASIELYDSKLSIGDKVEIKKAGQFYGKQVFVISLTRKGKVQVQGKDWVIAQFLQPSDLKLVERSEVRADELMSQFEKGLRLALPKPSELPLRYVEALIDSLYELELDTDDLHEQIFLIRLAVVADIASVLPELRFSYQKKLRLIAAVLTARAESRIDTLLKLEGDHAQS